MAGRTCSSKPLAVCCLKGGTIAGTGGGRQQAYGKKSGGTGAFYSAMCRVEKRRHMQEGSPHPQEHRYIAA